MILLNRHADIWSVMLPALHAARIAGRERVRSGTYISRYRKPEFLVNRAGWPQAVRRGSYSQASETDPPDWHSMFTLGNGGTSSFIPVDSIPELAAFIAILTDLASKDQEVSRLISSGPTPPLPERVEIRWDEISSLILVKNVLERAEALNIESDDELEDLLKQLEVAHLSDFLPTDLVAPLLLTDLQLEEPVQLGGAVWVEPLPQDFQIARAEISHGYRSENPYLLAAATHGVVLKNQKVPVGDTPGWLNLQSVNLSAFQLAAECIQMISGGSTGFAEVIALPIGWAHRWTHDLPAVQGQFLPGEYPVAFQELGWHKPPQSTIKAEQIPQLVAAFGSLSTSKPNVRLAARRARRCSLRSDDEDVLLDAAIGMEALLGKERDELTHRLAQRAAAALAPKWDPSAIYAAMKQVYIARSAVVHGDKPKNKAIELDGNSRTVPDLARYLLEELLRALLLSGTWTPESLDAKILIQLTTSTGDDHGV